MDLSNITENLNQIKSEDIANIKLQIQNLNDTIKGGLRSANLVEYRNTYVINAQDSLDATYPMYVHFNIISEMTKIVSVKLSFWFQNFRAYSTAAKSGGGQTSSSVTTPSGGGSTSGSTGTYYNAVLPTAITGSDNIGDQNIDGWVITNYKFGQVADYDHTHSISDHTHPAHDHTVDNHTHSTPNHTHDITYGIYEDSQSPTIMVYISKDNGKSYSLPLGSYSADHENLDITAHFSTAGSKMLKITSNARARLSVQITIKLDIKAR